MPMLGLSFSELKKVTGVVAILVGVAFCIGLVVGYKAGKSFNDSSKPSDTEITEEQRRKNDEIIKEIRQEASNDSGPSPPSNNSNSETAEQGIQREEKKLRDKYGIPSPSPTAKP